MSYDLALLARGRTGALSLDSAGLPAAQGLVRGGAKLAQRWALEFLTPLGSQPFRRERGSVFPVRLALGQLETEADVWAAFAAAMLTVEANLRADETAADPLSERYGSAELLGATADARRVLTLSVRLVSASGTTIQLQLLTPAPGGS